ncbi:hypothetical protein [uncultured Hymenobacter sp.]|uniref:hypothetical protein n=1 Tax=uncultured Hymenobacter sp. TaxID=170016 RepID=UPI0035CC1559
MATGNGGTEDQPVGNYNPYGLRTLAREQGLDNLGGLEAVWYTPVSNFRSWPAVGELVIGSLDLLPTAKWYQLVSTRGTLGYDQTPKPLGRHGELYSQKLKGTLSRHTGVLATGIETMQHGRFVALYRDLNGEVQLVGTPTEPLEWKDTYSAGSETQRNNYDWQLLCEGGTVRRARPYTGTWEVEGGTQENTVVLQPGVGGTVLLRTQDGRLLATVPAGKSIVLKSGFSLSYLIV